MCLYSAAPGLIMSVMFIIMILCRSRLCLKSKDLVVKTSKYLNKRPTCRRSQKLMSREINDIIKFLCTQPRRLVLRCKNYNKSQDEAQFSANERKNHQIPALKSPGINERVLFGSVGEHAGVCVCVSKYV